MFERMTLQWAREPTVVFRDCFMVGLLWEPPRGPVYQSCRVTVLPREQRHGRAGLRRDLNDLFPQWRERVGR